LHRAHGRDWRSAGLDQRPPLHPATALAGDIHKADPNVHGGTKYMEQLMEPKK
jgi:hypothetical protein